MDCAAKSDLFLFTDEKFDFDVSLSPASFDEDEVFVGPVSHKERCASVNAASRPEGDGGVRASWSPLSGDQLEEVCQEAHRLADRLQGSELSRPRGEDATPAPTAVAKDGFVRGVEAKLGVLAQTAAALCPIKRQTFCVQDSPMKQLPPVVQRRLLRGSGANTPTSTRPAATSTRLVAPVAASPAVRRSTSSPAAGVKPLPRTGLRGRAGLGVVLPSKPAAATTTSCSAGRSAAEKPRMQPPSRALGGWRRSPSGSRAGSCEDLLSDSASVASDISDSSINSSLLGKRTLAPPTKRALMNPSGVKAPPLQRRRMTERKNTSSSSSSVSSVNSSLSLSPATGKLNSSQSSATGPAPISRPANQSRPRRSTAAEPASSAAGRRCSLSTQARKLSEAERVKAARSTPLKRAEATPLQQTPAKRVLEKAASIPTAASARLQSGLKTKSKPEPSIVPTPSGRVGGIRQGDAPDVSKQKSLTSVSGVDSLPQTPSAGSCRSLQVKARRPSALPTPLRRRMSSIPVATPTRPPPTLDFGPAPSSARSQRSCSPAPADTQEAEPVDVQPFCLEEVEPVDVQPFCQEEVEPVDVQPFCQEEVEPVDVQPFCQEEVEPVDVQPFCLEEVEPVDVQPFCQEEAEPVDVQPFCLDEAETAAPPPTSAPQADQSENTDPGAPCQSKSEPNKNLIELETTEEKSKTQEVLLLDLPAPTLRPQEKLLIDLTNTPDLIRTSGKTCTGAQQLIDLSSPLIKWSPEEKRENNAPLINLSF